MYNTLEFDSLHKCPHCGNTGNINLEHQEILNGNLQKTGKGPLVYHCRSCGCNTNTETPKPQGPTQLLSIKELYNMSHLDLERYKVQMSLAAMKASTELEREIYRNHMNRANTIINNLWRR